MNHIISHKRLSIDTVKNIIASGAKLELSKDAEAAIVKCRHFLDTKMEDIGRPVYGVTTGFDRSATSQFQQKTFLSFSTIW